MKNTIVAFLLIIIPTLGICQSQYSARLTIGRANIGVSPDEEIWVTTNDGSLLHTDKIGDIWAYNPVGKLNVDFASIRGVYERITVFSNDTLMISGFIHGKLSNTDFVLWSGDKGETWEEIKFGKASWLDSFCHTEDGRAWMSGNTEYIYYTEDYGRTWTQIDKSNLIGNIRLVSAATSPDGQMQLYGASWGELYITNDNSVTLTPTPTPYSQGKYQFKYNHKKDPNKRPGISKIRFYGDKYLITQDSRVFITRADGIDWQPLKNCYDYEVTKAGNLYTVNKDGTVSLYDHNFKQIWSSSQTMSNLPQSITCQNESLFAICTDEVCQINPGEFVISGLFTDDFDIGSGFDELLYDYRKLTFEGNTYAYDNKDLLCIEVNSGKWYRLMTADFPIGNAVIFDGHLLISDLSFNQYYKIDVDNKTVTEYSFADDFIQRSNNPVISFSLGVDSQGCFHHDAQSVKYNRTGDFFVAEKSRNSSNKIDESHINRLVSVIIESRQHTISLSELEITDTDIKDFKKFIAKEAGKQAKGERSLEYSTNPYKFPDFDTDIKFYKNIADSLYAGAIPDSVINAALRAEYGNWSSTTNWKSVVIEFQGGQILKISNTDDKPNYMLTPWLVDYEGVKFKGNAISIGRILTRLSNGNFIASPFKDKNYVIFNIINYLYQQKLAD